MVAIPKSREDTEASPERRAKRQATIFEVRLVERMRAGDESARLLLFENSRAWAHVLARRYAGDLPIEDAEQEADMSLWATLPGWRPELGSLTTYVTAAIARDVKRAAARESAKGVHIPERAREQERAWFRETQRSLDAELTESSDGGGAPFTLHDMLADEQHHDWRPGYALEVKDEADERAERAGIIARTVASVLTARQAQVIACLYCAGAPVRGDFARVGRLLGISRETVRQSHQSALRRLRQSGAAGVLAALLATAST